MPTIGNRLVRSRWISRSCPRSPWAKLFSRIHPDTLFPRLRRQLAYVPDRKASVSSTRAQPPVTAEVLGSLRHLILIRGILLVAGLWTPRTLTWSRRMCIRHSTESLLHEA